MRSLERHLQRWYDQVSKDLSTLIVENYREVVLDREERDGEKKVCFALIGSSGF